MTTTFKKFLESSGEKAAFKKWEDMLHHIAEEELVACKVVEMFVKKRARSTEVHFSVQCNDKPRKIGLQVDLSTKLTDRLSKHNLIGLEKITTKVFNIGNSTD